MVTALSAAACRKDSYTPRGKLRACNLTSTFGKPWEWVSPYDRWKRSPLYLERGIAKAQLKDFDAAIGDYARALSQAVEGKPLRHLKEDGRHRSMIDGMYARIYSFEDGSLPREAWEKMEAKFR